MSNDESVFDGWRESKRKRRLRIVLSVIFVWNLIFIPIAILVWPRLPTRASMESTGPVVTAPPLSRPRATVDPTPKTAEDASASDVSTADVRADPPAVAQRSIDSGVSQILTELGVDQSGIADLATLIADAQRGQGQRPEEFSIDALLDAFDARNARPQTPSPPPVAPPLATQPASTQPVATQPAASAESPAEEKEQDTAEYKLTDSGFRVARQNAKSWTFEWHVSIRNKTTKSRRFACRVKFVDKDGIVIDEGFKLRSFAARQEETARGSVDIKLPYARDVVDMRVIASPR